jgi:hypothetical protein
MLAAIESPADAIVAAPVALVIPAAEDVERPDGAMRAPPSARITPTAIAAATPDGVASALIDPPAGATRWNARGKR